MSTNSYETECRWAKVEDLLPVFEAHVDKAAGGPLDHLNNPTDAALVRDLAAATIAGIPATRDRSTCRANRRRATWEPGDPCCEDHDFLPELWHGLADDAGLPLERHPSVTTIETLVRRLERRAKDAQRDAFAVIVPAA